MIIGIGIVILFLKMNMYQLTLSYTLQQILPQLMMNFLYIFLMLIGIILQ